MGYRRVIITRPGDVTVLKVEEVEELPEPKVGEARLRVLAAGVARADILMRRGRYPGKVPPMPYSPGYDIVGRIDCINGLHSDFKQGQIVAALTKVGGYSEYICVAISDLVKVPDGLDPADVVALILNYLTAYQMLHRFARIKSEQCVLIHAGASGVGTGLLHLGKMANLKMFATASRNKLDILKQLGAFPIDYSNEDFRQVIHQKIGAGVNAAFDPIGGSHLWRSYRTVNPSGILIAYGELSTAGTENPSTVDVIMHYLLPFLLRRMPGGRKVCWYEMFPFNKNHPDWYHQDLSLLINMLAGGQIKPVIAARLPLVEAARAHTMLESRQVIGKIVLVINNDEDFGA